MDKYDIIIVGSGMSGLVCGDILSREGYKICILEKNKQIGGCLQTYVRERVIFDAGVHYVGGLAEGQNLYQLFKYLGFIDQLKMERMDMDAFDKIVIDGSRKEYVFAQGYENFIQKLLVDFPDEETALRTYCDQIKYVCSKFPLYNLRSGGLYSEKQDVLEIDTKTFIESITGNKTLQQVLAGNNPLYAGQPDKTPFYIHALILNSYILSAWKFVDGGSQIAKYMARNIRQRGGDIFRNSKVVQIVGNGEKIGCVELADGKKIFGDKVISNMHPLKTLEITASEFIRPAYRNRLKTLENSVSCFLLNIVFKKDSFKYFKHNYYCFKDGHVWDMMHYTEANWPLGFAVFLAPSSKSSEFADGMTLYTYMRYDEVQPWQDTFNTVAVENDRGETYAAFKERKAQLLLDELEKQFPGIREHIQSYYAATPLSYRDYIGTDDGSMYGIVKDHRDAMKTLISPKTKLPGLYLTGQNLNLHGVLGCAISGIMTATAVMGNDDIIDKIRHA